MYRFLVSNLSVVFSRIGLGGIFLCWVFQLTAQTRAADWQQGVSYDIQVRLDDERHELQGDLSLRYTNNSPETLEFLLLHIWPQAYSNGNTPLAQQLLRQGKSDFHFATASERGGLDSLSIKVDGQTTDWTYYEGAIDIIQVALPSPLQTGQQLVLTTPFRVKIPQSFSRLGRVGESYQMTQWYPKPAVYDQDGWHPMSYLDNGEFYSEFGDFRVQIELPANYIVGSTGLLQTASERERLLALDRATRNWLDTASNLSASYVEVPFPPSAPETKRLEYWAENVHDFAWFADKRFHVLYDTLALAGKEEAVEVWSFFTDTQAAWWGKSMEYLKAATRFYSEQVGSYPYPSVAAAQSPRSAGGGMEYPMITLIGMEGSEESLDDVITHEVGHNWFYGVLGSNERDHAWMDEGLNSYYEYRYMRERYPESGGETDYDWLSYMYAASLAIDQPPATTSEQLSYNNYWISAYTKPQLALDELEREVGTMVLDQAMQDYFNTYAFRHPTPEDFKVSLESSLGKDLTTFFDNYIWSSGGLERPMAKERPLRLRPFIAQQQPDVRQLFWSPLLGFNANDGAMLGLALHNRSLEAKAFEWGLAPALGLSSSELVGALGLRYRILRPTVNSRQLVSHLALQRFSDREIREQAYTYHRLSAGLELQFAHPPITERSSSLALNYLGINRNRPTFDTLGMIAGDRNLQNNLLELSYRRKVSRLINPNEYQLRLSYRTAAAEDLFDEPSLLLELDWRGGYMYEQDKMIRWRLYAGYFLVNDFRDRNTTNDFRLALVDNANADYRYDDYYLGRGQDGWYEQQLELRQGGMRAPIGAAFNFGRSNDYVVALNLDTDLPFAPAGFPLRVYLDAGTYGLSPIQEGQVDAFQWVGGFSLTALKGQLGVFLPLFSSPEIRDRLAERGGLLDRIGFRLSLAKLAPWKVIDRQEF